MLLWSNFSSFPQYFLLVVRFSCLDRDKIFISKYAAIRDKRDQDNESQLYLNFFSGDILLNEYFWSQGCRINRQECPVCNIRDRSCESVYDLYICIYYGSHWQADVAFNRPWRNVYWQCSFGWWINITCNTVHTTL